MPYSKLKEKFVDFLFCSLLYGVYKSRICSTLLFVFCVKDSLVGYQSDPNQDRVFLCFALTSESLIKSKNSDIQNCMTESSAFFPDGSIKHFIFSF